MIWKTLPARIDEFRLGDEVLFYTPPSIDDSLKDSSAGGSYLIFEGQVRLLCDNIHLQRPVSADLLEAGAVFGADHLFYETPLPYRAIAAAACRIVPISDQQLVFQLEQLPLLRQYLHQSAQQRERLIFFKRYTQQRSIPIRTLKHILLPQLIEQRIKSGTILLQNLSTTGYFWLRAGQILDLSNPAAAPRVGDSWGYPDAVPESWVAQTDLVLYQLPLDGWETLNSLRI